MNLYAQEENDTIKTFSKEVKEGRIDPVNYDLKIKKAKAKYDSFISKVISFKPREYQTYEFASITQEELVNISVNIIRYIFGDINLEDEFSEFFQNMFPLDSDEALNSALLTVKNEDNKINCIIGIPTFDRISSIVAIVHEFIHFHASKINMDFNKKRYYEEILSIYAEKVAVSLLGSINVEPDLMRKIEETRLECIVWHYDVHPKELDWTINTYRAAKSQKNNFEAQMIVRQIEETVPWIKTPATLKNALQYKRNLADSYGIGYLYSESLLKRYLDDEALTAAKVRQVLIGEEKLQTMLDYFGINAKSSATYEAVEEKISVLRLK